MIAMLVVCRHVDVASLAQTQHQTRTTGSSSGIVRGAYPARSASHTSQQLRHISGTRSRAVWTNWPGSVGATRTRYGLGSVSLRRGPR